MAAEAAGYVADLGLVTLYQEGELEGVDYYYSRRHGYWDDYEDGEMGEIYSESLSVGNWLDAYGQPVELGDFMLKPEQLITRDAIDADDPIEKEGEGPTGNAGCTMEYWYRRGAVVFWPKALHAKTIARSNPLAACKQLLQQTKAPESAAKPDFLELGMALIEIFAHQPEPIRDYMDASAQAILIRAILPYPNWARPSTAKVEKLYPQFSAFLKDPVEKVYVYPVRQSVRDQMKQMVLSEGIDVDCKVVEKGRPYQLVCTKNNASYERALRVRAKDEQHLKALRQLCTRLSANQ